MGYLRSVGIGALLGFSLSLSLLAYACSYRKDIIPCRSVLNLVTLHHFHFTSWYHDNTRSEPLSGAVVIYVLRVF
ncbi:hypothetical protein EDD16DRAFT_1576418 [Pisolithus croceorrhizus]|nr:hypothetical protein EDD16DRAFT_1576418 [Pisolithus croceorrhizus]